MSSTDKKQNLKTIIWVIVIILLGILMFWGIYEEFKTQRDFQKHKEKEQKEEIHHH